MCRAPQAARFLHPEGHDYFAMLREKLHWSETPERLSGTQQVRPTFRARANDNHESRLGPHAPLAFDPQLCRRRRARCRIRRWLHGADRRDRRGQVDPARRAVAAAWRSLRDAAAAPGAERAELAAAFEIGERPAVGAWLAEQELANDGDEVLLRRTLDAQGRSRAWINGRPATLAHLNDLGAALVDLHGQHAHQSLAQPGAQRTLVDAFGGFTTLAREVAERWRAWRAAAERRDAAAHAADATAAERGFLDERRRELAALAVTESEWSHLSAAQSRLANAADLIEAATAGEAALTDGRRRARGERSGGS